MERAVNILSAIFDSFDDVWFFISPDFSIRYFNQKAFNNSKTFHNRELKAGDSILDYARDTKNNVDDRFVSNFQKALKGEIIKVEDHIVYNSTSIWTRTKYTPVFEHGQLLGISVVVEDITPQKLVEEERNKQQKEIIKLSNKTEDFVNIAGHELKTPLTSLRASLQIISRLLDNSSDIDEVKKFIDKSNISVLKLNNLIGVLINANRLTKGELKLEKKDFDLHELIEASSKNVLLDGKHKIEIDGPEELIVHADGEKIGHVLTHLINNALKYASKSPRIIIRLEDFGTMVKVSVQDFGPGIAKEKTASLFKRFYESEPKSNDSGLGLGLYISEGIIKQHQGEIGVETKKGSGSTFWFTIPKDNVNFSSF